MKKLSDNFVGKNDILGIIKYNNISEPENNPGVKLALQVIDELSQKKHEDKYSLLSKYIYNCYDNHLEEAIKKNEINDNDSIIALSILLAYSTIAVNLIPELFQFKFYEQNKELYVEQINERANTIYVQNYHYIKKEDNSNEFYKKDDFKTSLTLETKENVFMSSELEGDDFINYISEQYKDGENYNHTIKKIIDFDTLSLKVSPQYSGNITHILNAINTNLIAINHFNKEYAFFNSKKTFYIKDQIWFDKDNFVYGQGFLSLLIYNKTFELKCNTDNKEDINLIKSSIEENISYILDRQPKNKEYWIDLPF